MPLKLIVHVSESGSLYLHQTVALLVPETPPIICGEPQQQECHVQPV